MADARQKGFIAVDIDGTALVQSIDHNPRHGVQNSVSDMRELLIDELQLAQANGYDIYILTARPELADKLLAILETRVGTKSTDNVIGSLQQNNIKIKGIRRAGSTGLKGQAMSTLIDDYIKETNNPDAIGILVDDQLKQVNDVRKMSEATRKNITAFDINSPEDIDHYHALIGAIGAENKLKDRLVHIRSILDVTNLDSEMKKNYSELINLNKKLKECNLSVDQTKLMNSILDELLYRLYEPEQKNYQPDIENINTCAKELTAFITKLNKNPKSITLSDTRKLMMSVASPFSGTMSKTSTVAQIVSADLALEKNEKKYEEKLKTGQKHADLFDCNKRHQQTIAKLLDSITQDIIKPVQDQEYEKQSSAKPATNYPITQTSGAMYPVTTPRPTLPPSLQNQDPSQTPKKSS